MNTRKDLLELLREVNVRRCEAADGMNHPIPSWSALEWAGAAGGECGEVLNVAKKIRRMETGIANQTKDPQSIEDANEWLAKEIGDTIVYLDLLAARQHLELGACIMRAFNGVSKERGLPYWL